MKTLYCFLTNLCFCYFSISQDKIVVVYWRWDQLENVSVILYFSISMAWIMLGLLNIITLHFSALSLNYLSEGLENTGSKAWESWYFIKRINLVLAKTLFDETSNLTCKLYSLQMFTITTKFIWWGSTRNLKKLKKEYSN